ncbi:glycerol-3-phosphate acyltransferase 1, mitochondrial-like [Bufo gargarizans]|uniref:glycerol-3-phosphate acyltransferase 1, mitochondrial-like n=1 Tax=Bufo gargarizans TaxID=30331 RepID=UPI001CF5A234|nr:glycerol-3-phosphate acyltransferase 1, mitochondrial-like [Bufo gargarizans]
MEEAGYSLGMADIAYQPSSVDYTRGRLKNCTDEWGDRISSPAVFTSSTLKWKETLLSRKRPFVGRCCYMCTPQSRDRYYNPSIPSLGLRNVIYINETHTRYVPLCCSRLCQIRFNNYHQTEDYPFRLLGAGQTVQNAV